MPERAHLLQCAAGFALVLALSGCNALTRLSNVGEPPALTAIQDPRAAADYQPVSLPQPAAHPIERNPNSLWRTGARAFFKDQRASEIGDILTVEIALDDNAEINNSTSRTRDAAEDAALSSFLGFESELDRIFPDAIDPDSLVDADSDSAYTGTGTIERDEEINVNVAAVITQVLPNGNLVIHGRQETRINFEARELQIAGVIRPEDITSDNTIPYEKVAEARLAYGGRGQITDFQQPRYGQQIFDIIFPF